MSPTRRNKWNLVVPTGELRAWLREINRPPNGWREAGALIGVGEETMRRLVMCEGSRPETIAKAQAAMLAAGVGQ